MELLFNPAVIAIILLCLMCLKHINILLAIIVATLVTGLLSGMNIEKIMSVFISGMGDNSETALSYILLGAFAATMAHSGFTNKISKKISNIVANKKYILFSILAIIAMASQNIIPIHIGKLTCQRDLLIRGDVHFGPTNKQLTHRGFLRKN